MKVLLVNPLQSRLVSGKGRVYNRVWPPLDLASTAAALRARGVEAALLDAHALRLGPEQAAARASGFDRVFVTSSALDRWQCPVLDLEPFLKTFAAVKRAVPEAFVLGSHGTVRPAELLELTGARGVARGEPEGVACALAAGAPLSEVAGLTWRDGGRVVHNPDAAPVKLDDLPPAAYDLLPPELYSYEVMGADFTLFELSRGCASDCSFCLLKTYGDGVRRKSLARVTAEIADAVARGARRAYFIDLELTVLRAQVLELCDWLIEKDFDLEWCCQTRFDLVDDELLERMRRAKCTLIHFGVEAGSDEALARTGKGLTLAAVRTGMARVKKAGIRTACFFLLGLPGCDEKDARDISALARELAPDYPLFHVAAPYPGTRLHAQAAADPALRFSDDSLFPEAVEDRFTLPQLKRLARSAYLGYYARPSYLLGRLRRGDWRSLGAQARLFWSFVSA